MEWILRVKRWINRRPLSFFTLSLSVLCILLLFIKEQRPVADAGDVSLRATPRGNTLGNQLHRTFPIKVFGKVIPRAGTDLKTPPPPPAFRVGRQSLEGAGRDDPALVDYIRRSKLRPPAMGPYHLQHPLDTYSSWHSSTRVLDNILRHKTKGFFVEAGAHDGEHWSKTLYFELRRQWKGLLIEADPVLYQKLVTKGRKTHTMHACLSPTNFTTTSTVRIRNEIMNQTKVMGPTTHQGRQPGSSTGKLSSYTLQCFPLYSIMLALTTHTIDLLSLDIGGQELQVLKTLPFDKLEIHVVIVKVKHAPEGWEAFKDLMKANGFTLLKPFQDHLIFGRQDPLDAQGTTGP